MMMTTNDTDLLVDEYLRAVERALVGVPVARRAELLTDLRHHIAAEREGLDTDDEAGVREILDRLGDPDVVAAEARLDGVEDAAPVAHPRTTGAERPTRRLHPALWILIVLGALATLCSALALVAGLFLAGTDSGSTDIEPARPTPIVTVNR